MLTSKTREREPRAGRGGGRRGGGETPGPPQLLATKTKENKTSRTQKLNNRQQIGRKVNR